MYKSFYSDTCFKDKNKWYYKIIKKNVIDFLKPYFEFKKNKNEDLVLWLKKYCKPENPPINIKLRNGLKLDVNDKRLIKFLDSLIQHFKIKDNIIVYRGVDIDVFQNGNTIFAENGYLSTSLVKEAIWFCHNKKYRYKIFVPKGTCGFCPQDFTCRVVEYELILPRGSKLQLIRKKKRKKYIEIICKYVDNKI